MENQRERKKKKGSRKKYFSRITKSHGKRKAFEITGNTKERTRWRSMITNIIRHTT